MPKQTRAAHEVARVRGDIKVRGLSFSYPEDERLVLENVSLDIPAGKTVALVGRSGSGKTTLVQLLARFYPLETGRFCWMGFRYRAIPAG